ncbi:activator of Hsp90 ATPase [Mycotypha africana]|uniref:activator of Hsp90 ATPase n=1 Tax=Mycotypha africana TaxID=64632 RepID=UPI0023010C2A|nr:activator of Hsp90 ATPase [Mycotypha africana]KAI8982033.1 activator of Hsp90 ATPase [Mycotypha africana]
MSNWKNVNNWHWVNKNCFKWAENWFNEQLVGLEGEKDGNKVSVSKVVDCSGDVDLNQRKGKIITIYDVALKLNWKGTLKDETEVTGSIQIPEIAHDTDPEDYVFDISIFDDSNEKQVIKEAIRKSLVPQILKKFETFSSSMIKENCEDVYIDAQKMGTATPPRLSSPSTTVKSSSASTTTATASNTTSSSSTTAKVINTTSLNDQEEFQTSARELYLTLTTPERAAVWTRGHVILKPEVGAHYEFFNGNVTGEFLEIEPEKKIVQTWRLRSWPQGHYSTVTMEFHQGSESVMLKLSQTGIPVGEQELTLKNWQGYYWRSIKGAFGYGVNF